MEPRKQRQVHIADYKYVGDISEHSDIEQKYKALVADMTERQKNLDGMQKAMEDYEEECHKARKKQWDDISKELVTKGKIAEDDIAQISVNPHGQVFIAVMGKKPKAEETQESKTEEQL